jgi:mono/diheme cytochrome c family protein
MMLSTITRISVLLLVSAAMMSCRGQKSEKPPIHPQQNMYFQERFNAQQPNPFFEDGRAKREPVEGTIARGNLRHDTALFEGTDANGNYVTENPMQVNLELLQRGRVVYDIYCKVCHGGTGDGQGIIITGGFGYVPAPTFHRTDSYTMPDGEFYSAIANGVRNMPAYNTQIKVEDRWAIVAYIRALQRSQNIPEAEMERFDVDIAQLMEEDAERRAREAALAEARAVRGDEEVSVERGERLFVQNACGACHSTDGRSLVGPTFLGLYGSERTFADGSSQIADEDYIIESIVEPGALVVEGYDNVMVAYTHLSESELQSLVEFIRSLSDN